MGCAILQARLLVDNLKKVGLGIPFIAAQISTDLLMSQMYVSERLLWLKRNYAGRATLLMVVNSSSK